MGGHFWLSLGSLLALALPPAEFAAIASLLLRAERLGPYWFCKLHTGRKEDKRVFWSKPERFFRKRPLLYSVATYRKLALLSAGEDSNHPCLEYWGGGHPSSGPCQLGGGKREQREEENRTCQEHGSQVCPSLGVGPKGDTAAFLFSLYSWLEVQKETDPTRRFTKPLNSKKHLKCWCHHLASKQCFPLQGLWVDWSQREVRIYKRQRKGEKKIRNWNLTDKVG